MARLGSEPSPSRSMHLVHFDDSGRQVWGTLFGGDLVLASSPGYWTA